MNFSIRFLFNNDGLLYFIITNVYPVLIVGFALYNTTVPNERLHTAAFCELFYLVRTFLLPLSNNFQPSLLSFRKPLLNLHEAITALQLVLKSPIVPHALDLLYYNPAEMAATNKTIAVAMPKFMAKATNNKH